METDGPIRFNFALVVQGEFEAGGGHDVLKSAEVLGRIFLAPVPASDLVAQESIPAGDGRRCRRRWAGRPSGGHRPRHADEDLGEAAGMRNTQVVAGDEVAV